MYKTVEARLNNNTVIFNDDFNAPQKNMKVLITFIELKNNNVSPISGSEEVLGTKDHNDFISLLKNA
ncbi:MAG: hypothetical protein Q9M94_04115 [Candidatus Gracilibacteria bacterium]|nr:hypothetical protein [Candidatus Gracilibacteria bacterium]MDQ7023036.1 hypothetical protein [Candidatus Gracilibacteria bacterium]